MIDATELAAMRAEAEASLPESGTLRRPTYEDDGAGGRKRTDATTIAADHPHAIGPAGGQEQELGGQLREVVTHRIVLPHDTLAQDGDELVSGSRTFRLVAVPRGGSERTAISAAAVEFN